MEVFKSTPTSSFKLLIIHVLHLIMFINTALASLLETTTDCQRFTRHSECRPPQYTAGWWLRDTKRLRLLERCLYHAVLVVSSVFYNHNLETHLDQGYVYSSSRTCLC